VASESTEQIDIDARAMVRDAIKARRVPARPSLETLTRIAQVVRAGGTVRIARVRVATRNHRGEESMVPKGVARTSGRTRTAA
jgi:hypothetical protein